MNDKKPTEIPGIAESDLAELIAGARIACGGNDFAEQVFAEAERIRAIKETPGKEQTRVE